MRIVSGLVRAINFQVPRLSLSMGPPLWHNGRGFATGSSTRALSTRIRSFGAGPSSQFSLRAGLMAPKRRTQGSEKVKAHAPAFTVNAISCDVMHHSVCGGEANCASFGRRAPYLHWLYTAPGFNRIRL